jgi:protein-tyrosine-phosphatase
VQVESAGYHEWGPFPREAHPFARRAVTDACGADLLASHVAQRWHSDMVTSSTCVVVAEEWMRADFRPNRVVSMRGLAGESGDVVDPYGSDYSAYVECVRLIQRLIAAGLPLLMGSGDSP